MRFAFPASQSVAVELRPTADTPPQLNAAVAECEAAEAMESPAEEPITAITASSLAEPISPVVAQADLPQGIGISKIDNTPDLTGVSDVPNPATSETSHTPPVAIEPEPVPPPRPRSKRKVIAFPHQPRGAETRHRLADPVLREQPRILDVPEELEAYPTTPFLEGLQFEPATQVSAPVADHIELPFRAAGTARRVYAGILDGALVLAATTVFALVVHKMLPGLTLTKPVRLMASLVLLLLWAVFQYLLLVYAGRTVGMCIAGLRLRMFSGKAPTFRHRRNRAIGLYLSTASLGMGLLWALVDIDNLCWHDRISGTYLTDQT